MSSLRHKIVGFFKKYNISIDRKIVSYLICIVIATALWFLNALNKDYTAEISYPVKYTNLPRSKHLVSPLPSTILLEVKAKGFALLGHRISTSFLPITLNVSSFSNHLLEKNDLLEYTLNTNDIKDKISSQLNADIKLLDVYPSTIDFKFGKSKSKKVVIRPTLRYTLKRQYILKRIAVIPDSIVVTGPSVIIDTIGFIATEPWEIKELGKDIARELSLQPVSGCSFEETKAQVDILVEQFTEARKTLRIIELNVPDSLNLRLFPDYINITYDIGLSNYDKVVSDDFVFVVDYDQTKYSSILDIKVSKAPLYIKNLDYTPQKVEYIIEKK